MQLIANNLNSVYWITIYFKMNVQMFQINFMFNLHHQLNIITIVSLIQLENDAFLSVPLFDN